MFTIIYMTHFFITKTAEIKHNHVMKVINNFDLKNKFISFSADNTNFGGIQKKGKNNTD